MDEDGVDVEHRVEEIVSVLCLRYAARISRQGGLSSQHGLQNVQQKDSRVFFTSQDHTTKALTQQHISALKTYENSRNAMQKVVGFQKEQVRVLCGPCFSIAASPESALPVIRPWAVQLVMLRAELGELRGQGPFTCWFLFAVVVVVAVPVPVCCGACTRW